MFLLPSTLFMFHQYLISFLKHHCEPVMCMWLASNGSLVLWLYVLIMCSFLVILMRKKPNSQCWIVTYRLESWISFFCSVIHSSPCRTLLCAPGDQTSWTALLGLPPPVVDTVRRYEYRTRGRRVIDLQMQIHGGSNTVQKQPSPTAIVSIGFQLLLSLLDPSNYGW